MRLATRTLIRVSVLGLIVSSILCVAPAVAQPRLTMDWAAMAERLVAQLAPQPGERILLLARPGDFDDILPHLRYALMEAGAVDLGVVDVLEEPFPEDWDAEVLRRGSAASRAAYKEMFRDVDGAIMMPGARAGQPAYSALQDWLNEDVGRTIHFHWTQNGSAFPIPGQPLPGQTAIDAHYQRALLETDYEALAANQREFVQVMRDAEVRVTSPIGTDISFRIGDRPVNLQDGDASKARTDQGVILIDREIELPAGSIRVAPLEETVNGVVAFPHSQWDGRPVIGLRITFERGRIVGVTADSGLEAVQAELDSVPSANSRWASIRCSPCLSAIRGFPTTAMATAWSDCHSATTPSLEAPSPAGMSAGTSLPTPRSDSMTRSGYAPAAWFSRFPAEVPVWTALLPRSQPAWLLPRRALPAGRRAPKTAPRRSSTPPSMSPRRAHACLADAEWGSRGPRVAFAWGAGRSPV